MLDPAALFPLNLMHCQMHLQISRVRNIGNVYKLSSVAFCLVPPTGGLHIVHQTKTTLSHHLFKQKRQYSTLLNCGSDIGLFRVDTKFSFQVGISRDDLCNSCGLHIEEGASSMKFGHMLCLALVFVAYIPEMVSHWL